MVKYDFWFATAEGGEFRCIIEQREGNRHACLEATAQVWEALTPVGNALTCHPTTGETPDEFRARAGELMAGTLFSRMKPSMLAELYSDLEETAESQEGEALTETQRIARIVHAELLTSVGADEAHERIKWAHANT